ncbi:hypothetical protein CNMCM7691_004299 [Aspergillus felis]|uniref:Methyltransferase type 12 domain-containing protein n=1 Tax=Aspergillus felis TaxID=1287682 RepID=A0A8H6R511_9EURO|nr:hypothetical protein CNMCM7691_004299 [Aspergillus felis]
MSDLTATNRTHFNNVASTHHTDFGPLIETVMEEIADRHTWISRKLATGPHHERSGESHSIRLLDYACGAGTATKALLPYTTQAIGLDLSENMVAEYNHWARVHGCPPEKMRAYRLDLLDCSAAGIEGLELSGFDVVIVCMALHHVTDAQRLLARLAGCLKPGGVCVVIDGFPTPTVSPGEDMDTADLRAVLEPQQLGVLETINKHGFTEEEMRALYEGAGLGRNFEYEVIGRPLRFTMFGHSFSRRGFIARGER